MSAKQEPRRREGNEVEFSRIVAFSDGVFAIAITLLVLNLGIESGIPGDRLWHALWEQREDFLAFGISFAVIGRFWVIHHRFFGEVRAFDGRLITLNIVYLACIVLIPFSSQLLGDYGGEAAAVVVYAVNLAACVLVGFRMNAYARGAGLTTIDDATHRENRIRAGYISGVFLLAIPLAFVAPSYAPLLWLALFFDPAPRLAQSH
ncbi:MAG TPA: TMEM175 family protein [Solirubrobacterales bacterium]